ncbi:hypothetical protein, partial [Tahibacter caeni]|uniref:hypothetical protein n=1 Tax=Tahibacter caeni TaxID=1453545 RepID=UPI0021476510
PGDEALALAAATAARLACERAEALGLTDEWTEPTLLGLAFAAHDIARADELARRVARGAGESWKLETTLDTLQEHVDLMPPPRLAFETIVDDLRRRLR